MENSNTSFLIDWLDFGVEFSDVHLTKLKASPHANIIGIDRYTVISGMFATKFDLATSVGKYIVIVKDDVIATKLATAFVTGKSIDLFEKLED
jgi:hypothetical protein|nr:MAG TPA: hypothetical protein [Caudoviricetes sp.]